MPGPALHPMMLEEIAGKALPDAATIVPQHPLL